MRPVLLNAALAAAVLLVPAMPARAAESYDNCVDYIDTLPAVITTQGVWCLRKDLSGGIASGTAISVQANNVTIECNQFKIGNLAASDANTAVGIGAVTRSGVTVRGCNVRGFGTGTSLSGGSHVVEDSKFVLSRQRGIHVAGGGNIVRRNQVVDTFGASSLVGILASGDADIEDNIVDGMQSWSSNVHGIQSDGAFSTIRHNHVRDLTAASGALTIGIWADGLSSALVAENYVGNFGYAVYSYGIRAADDSVIVRDNSISGFEDGLYGTDSGGNVVN